MKVTLNFRDGRVFDAEAPGGKDNIPPAVVTYKARNELRRTFYRKHLSTEYFETPVHNIIAAKKRPEW